jgi:hypothetical protein
MTQTLQKKLPYDPLDPRPLPGVQPLALNDWLLVDEAFAGQMAERTRLLKDHRSVVLALDETARPAAEELLELVLQQAYAGAQGRVVRPDGVAVEIDRTDPLGTLGHLVQEDLCILQKHGAEHVLTGAVLCFPASWTLAEKFMRPLIGIHDPVASYDAPMASRVQRLFDGVQVGRPLWRFNALWYADAALHQPRSIHNRRVERSALQADFLRSERQCILRLPVSEAVVFSIHTYVVARQDVVTKPDA